MKTKLLLLLITTASVFNAAYTQNSFGFFAGGGTSNLHKSKYPGYNLSGDMNYRLTTKNIFASMEGVFCDFLLKNKFIFGIKLFHTTGGSEIIYTKTFVNTNPNSNILMIEYQTIWNTHTRALGFNPYFGYKYKKFSLIAGMQVLRFYWESGHMISTENSNGVINTYYTEDYILKGHIGIDFGITTGIAYHLNKNLILEANFYYGLHRTAYITDEFTLKATQLTIGLKVPIFISEKNKSKQTEQRK